MATPETRPSALERLATSVFGQVLKRSGWSQAMWQGCRKLLIRAAGDPACRLWVHGRLLWLPLSHALPTFLRDHPLYDSLPSRLGRFIRRRRGPLVCIDVGANVGDTVAAFRPEPNDRFLAIEPSSKYLGYLRRNFDHPNVVTRWAAVSDTRSGMGVGIQERNGTASVRECENPEEAIPVEALDTIVSDEAFFVGANVIKIDTDGYDFAAVMGAPGLLARGRPALLLECGYFGRESHADDCLRMFELLRGSGYSAFLVYDNFGFLMGCHHLSRPGGFLDLIFYQLTSPFYYFDLLFMTHEEASDFAAGEREFFLGRSSDSSVREAARRLLASAVDRTE